MMGKRTGIDFKNHEVIVTETLNEFIDRHNLKEIDLYGIRMN